MKEKAVQEFLGGVSQMSIWRWRNNPAMHFPEPIKINGRKLYKRAEIEAWMERQRSAPPPAGDDETAKQVA
jgi:predicted DNA-binding transcriptional regulator AlpA